MLTLPVYYSPNSSLELPALRGRSSASAPAHHTATTGTQAGGHAHSRHRYPPTHRVDARGGAAELQEVDEVDDDDGVDQGAAGGS